MDISSLLEVEVKEGKPSDLPNNGEIEAYKNIPDFSIRDIASVRFRKLHCTACDLHIGSAPAEAHNMHEHPVLHVLLCTNCRNFYGDGTFEQGDDATDMFCRWCANGGNLYCCSYCSNTFCYNCIKRNFDPMIRKKIERDEKWKCFVCNPADLYRARAACWALLQHVQTVTRILQTDRKMTPKEIEAKMNLDESQCCTHKNKRKRSETVSDDEEHDETYIVPRKKRRRLVSGKRKRRVIKLEMHDGTSDPTSLESTNNQIPTERVAMRELDDVSLVDARRNRSEVQCSQNDELAKLSPEELPLAVRQRNRRLHTESMSLTKFSINDDEIPPPLLECDQSMVEGAESLNFGVSQVPTVRASSSSNTELPRNIGISPVPMVNLLQRPGPLSGPLVRGTKTHRLIRGIGGTPVLVRKITPLGGIQNTGNASSSVPMVTIPSRNHVQSGNRVSVIQPASKSPQDSQNSNAMTRPIRPRPLGLNSTLVAASGPGNSQVRPGAPPSVIDLDSDSDDPVILVTPSRERRNSESNDRVPGLSTVTYPIRPDDGLMTVLAATPRTADNEENEKLEPEGETPAPVRTFVQTIRGPTKSIDHVLDSLKSKLKKVMESTMLFSPDKELLAAKAKTRAVNRTIKRTVAELTSLNDNLVSAYHAYKRERTNEKIATESMTLGRRQKSSRFVPLDMECVRESEPELDEVVSDDDSNDEADNVQNFTPFREIRPFRRRVHRAVEARPMTKNKSVQVYDAQLRDCEKSISYALLLKADYDSKRERNVLRPVVVPDENFGKYEEEFINYLQHIEDHGIETEESRNCQPSDGISVNELVEADISAIIREIATSEKAKNYEVARGDSPIDENVEILEEHVEILTTKSITSDELNPSVSSNDSDDETLTTTPSEKKDPENRNENTAENEDTLAMDTSGGTIGGTIGEKEDSSRVVEETSKEDSAETRKKPSKNKDEPAADEETVLAVRALTVTMDTSGGTIEEKEDSSPVVEETSKEDSAATGKKKRSKKKDESAFDEETVLAVRALMRDDTTSENGRKMDIINSSKPIDSDDECTILD